MFFKRVKMLTCVPMNVPSATQLHVKKIYFQPVKLLLIKQQTSRALGSKQFFKDVSEREHWIICLEYHLLTISNLILQILSHFGMSEGKMHISNIFAVFYACSKHRDAPSLSKIYINFKNKAMFSSFAKYIF